MRVEYDRETCIGMFQCVEEWGDFEKDVDAGKAKLVGGTEIEADWGEEVYAVDVPDGEEFEAEFAGRVCPVDAIRVFDDDGERVV
ncbi:MAG: ferredoxin [Haloferacaceae archaeon]